VGARPRGKNLLQDTVGVARAWEGGHHLCAPTHPRTTPPRKRSANCAQNRSKMPVDGANKRSAGRGRRKKKPLNGVKMRNAR
jgi:hypothetical protein